jgi:hypothetical protein
MGGSKKLLADLLANASFVRAREAGAECSKSKWSWNQVLVSIH